MADFVVLDTATGAILRSGNCPLPQVDLQAGPGEVSILVDQEIRDDTHYLSAQGFVPLPPRPTEDHQFDTTTGQWTGDVTRAKRRAHRFIKDATENVRPDRDIISLYKEEEARRWQAATPPRDIAGYPFIAAEIGVTAATGNGVVQIWQNRAQQWITTAAALEKIRMTAHAAVDISTTPEEIKTALVQFSLSLQPYR